MPKVKRITRHFEIVGADGVHVGTVDGIEGNRIRLISKDSGEGHHKGHHHYIALAQVVEIEGNRIWLSANADVAIGLEQEKDGGPVD